MPKQERLDAPGMIEPVIVSGMKRLESRTVELPWQGRWSAWVCSSAVYKIILRR
jgi:hypothetical protein